MADPCVPIEDMEVDTGVEKCTSRRELALLLVDSNGFPKNEDRSSADFPEAMSFPKRRRDSRIRLVDITPYG